MVVEGVVDRGRFRGATDRQWTGLIHSDGVTCMTVSWPKAYIGRAPKKVAGRTPGTRDGERDG